MSGLLNKLINFKTIIMPTRFNGPILAREYVKLLSDNSVLYHFDEDAFNIRWDHYEPSEYELDLMNEITNMLYCEEMFDEALKLGYIFDEKPIEPIGMISINTDKPKCECGAHAIRGICSIWCPAYRR